ncbi:hypothetical protein J7643_08070 [bacterium]|nr:hypothetical protein [bacterium]
MRRHALGWLLGASLCLVACGTTDDLYPTVPDDPYPSDVYTFPGDDDYPNPSATSSATPAPVEGESPSGNGSVLPNDFYRYIGERPFVKSLYQPRALAAFGNDVLVADGNRTDPMGAYGALFQFDADGSDAALPIGSPYLTLNGTGGRLAASVKGVAVSPQVVYALDDNGVYGFMRDSHHAVNLGAPYASTGRDIVAAKDTVYVARDAQISAYSVVNFAPIASLSVNVAARGVGSDATGRLYAATSAGVVRYDEGQEALVFDGRGADRQGPGFDSVRDVAVDPRNGDIYALDVQAVLRFDSSGRFLSRFGTTLIQGGSSIAVAENGTVFVLDAATNKVLQFKQSP